MRKLYLLLFISTVLLSCRGSKTIYEDKTITESKLDKLARDYSANPRDTSLANQVTFAYNYLHGRYMAAINQYQYTGNLEEKERLLSNYIALQSFYDRVRSYYAVDELVKPSSVRAEIEKTKLELVSGHYEKAEELLKEDNWKTNREAYRSLILVQDWMPGYKDSKQMLKEAKDGSMINAVVLPLRSEGYYNTGNMGGGLGGILGPNFPGNLLSGPRLSEQLVRDLGSSYNSGGFYKVYNTWEVKRLDRGPDWSVEPVWTELRVDDPRYQRSDRRVEKRVEVGKDTANRPIYKTLTANLSITEATYNAYGRLEIRIYDEVNKENVARNSWYETHNVRVRWATYTGDAGALSNEDWEMVNAARNNNNRTDPTFMENKLLEKIYPNLLNYLRNRLGN